jgi:hypothetical protein
MLINITPILNTVHFSKCFEHVNQYIRHDNFYPYYVKCYLIT